MLYRYLKKADNGLRSKLNHPELSKDELSQKKIYWYASLSVTLMIFLLTLTFHMLFPKLKILIYYGFALSVIFSQGIILPFFIKKVTSWHRFIDQLLVAIVTFIAILKLGGIPYSGGLIFVGLALVFFSLNYFKKKATIAIYLVYIVTVILAGILHPKLTVPPEMTPKVNISLFVINLIWISGFATAFVLNFISQRVHIEEIKTQRLKELDEAKTRLYTNITHEFRTPLTIITGMSDLIRTNPEKWLSQGTEKIDRNANILLNLVNQMLDLSKLEAGAMKPHMIKADIVVYIRNIIEMFRSIATKRNIKLIYESNTEKMIMDYDSDKTMIILSNLLSNALKFTSPGGRVKVSASVIKNENEADTFKLVITDTGPGIPEKDLPYIFDRFYRIEDRSSQRQPGTGLGLSITSALVNLLEGNISVESKPGKGSSFTITLPIHQYANLQGIQEIHKSQNQFSHLFMPSEAEQKKSDCTDPEKELILIVEDNEDVIHLLVELLDDEYNSITAKNGREGFQKASEYIPDIILSDIMMPEMDGIELLQRLKKNFVTSHIPVVLLTAKSDISSRLEGLEHGADAYISKPFDKDELRMQLKNLVKIRQNLRKRYSFPGEIPNSGEKHLEKEDAFILKLREIMLKNVHRESFEINDLCKEIGLSRTQLYRKFNSLTNRTLAEYFRSLRLHYARELLISTEINVSEVAYKTGFKNLSHFSKVFKKEFGVTPSLIKN